MSDPDLHSLAREIRNAYRTGPIDPPAEDCVPNDVAAGYAVQNINIAHWLSEGRRRAGWKIGLTSPQAQSQLGTSEPDYGMLFSDMEIIDGATIAHPLHQPRAEAEIAFGIAARISDPEVASDAVAAAVAWMAPAIEIVDSRFANWRVRIVDTIADNASSALFVIGGDRRPFDHGVLLAQVMEMQEDGRGIASGAATASLGDPLNAATWLARRLAQNGNALAPGDVVLSGAFAAPAPMTAGRTYSVSMPAFRPVAVTYAP
jgi:2-keto-4-pentenoate hydratase